MATKDVKRQLPRVTGLVLLLLVLIDVIFTILFFYFASEVDSFMKILDKASEAVAESRSFVVTLCTVSAFLCIAKAVGSIFVYLRRKEGFWLYTLATLIFIILFIVLGIKYSVFSFALKPIIALLIMNAILFGSLFLRSNGASVWSQLKMIQWKKNEK